MGSLPLAERVRALEASQKPPEPLIVYDCLEKAVEAELDRMSVAPMHRLTLARKGLELEVVVCVHFGALQEKNYELFSGHSMAAVPGPIPDIFNLVEFASASGLRVLWSWDSLVMLGQSEDPSLPAPNSLGDRLLNANFRLKALANTRRARHFLFPKDALLNEVVRLERAKRGARELVIALQEDAEAHGHHFVFSSFEENPNFPLQEQVLAKELGLKCTRYEDALVFCAPPEGG